MGIRLAERLDVLPTSQRTIRRRRLPWSLSTEKGCALCAGLKALTELAFATSRRSNILTSWRLISF